MSEEEKDNLAQELACFLRELHRLHIEETDSYEEDMKLKYRDDRDMLVKLISHKLDNRTASKLDDLFKGIFSNKDLLDNDKGLVHNDFSCSNILFDTEKKRLSGVIDFGDSCVSDIDNDFYCLLEESEEELGREFGLKFLSHYGYKDVDRLLRKADFHDRYWCMEQILYGYEYGYDEWISEGMKGLKEWTESV